MVIHSVVELRDHVIRKGREGGSEPQGHVGAVWVLRFSKDGRLLASGGQCGNIFLWKVSVNEGAAAAGSQTEPMAALEALPFKVLGCAAGPETGGHSDAIVDIAWSHKKCIASASVDQTVRIWHVVHGELRVIRYPEIATTVSFHPVAHDVVLSGCLDGQVRMYDLSDRKDGDETGVVEACDALDTKGIVTALTLSEDGATLVIGLFEGTCMFCDLDIENRKIQDGVTLKKVKSRRGRNAKGHKITGLEYRGGPKRRDFDAELLVSTVDSRIRRYRVNNGDLLCKYKGLSNVGFTKKMTGEVTSTQIRASVTEDCELIASGSEDGYLYLWAQNPSRRRFSWFSRRHVNDHPLAIFVGKREAGLASGDGSTLGGGRTRSLATSTAFVPLNRLLRPARDRSSLSSLPPERSAEHHYLVAGLSTGEIITLKVHAKEADG